MVQKKQRNNKKYIGFIILAAMLLGILWYAQNKPTVDDYESFKESNENITVPEELQFIKDNIVKTSVPRDGIPPIDKPKYFDTVTLAEESGEIEEEDIVFGLNYKGFVAAYPQDILYWHEIVNEEIEGEKVSITYCPLTATIIGYKGYSLGVSGSLYNSNLVMYDRKTEGYIPQILGQFIDSEKQGVELETIKVDVTTWKQWKDQYPETKVLSRKTGSFRAYDDNPYPGYETVLNIWFPVVAESKELHSKEIVFGIDHKGEFLAIEKKGFKEMYPNGYTTTISNEKITVTYNEQLDILETNKDVTAFEGYWFAWYAYHPETKLIKTTKE